jgi:hypothetical protein
VSALKSSRGNSGFLTGFCYQERRVPMVENMKIKTHTWPAVNLIPLQQAVLCADCEVISEGENGHCVACGSQATISLCKVMGSNASLPSNPSLQPVACPEPEAATKVQRLAPQVA